MTDNIDPTKAGIYPVILSDALLGKRSQEAFTSIKYNFKPEPTVDTLQAQTTIHPSDTAAESYNLAVTEKDDEYAYHGTRQPSEGQYVLVFSPERKAFILHQVDSTFNMNVTSTPWDQDQDSLRTTYPHLTATPRETDTNKGNNGDSKRRKADTKAKAQPKAVSKPQARAQPKTQTKTQTKTQQPRKAKAIQREPTPTEESSEEDFTIEYPDGPPRKSNNSMAHAVKNELWAENEEEERDMEEEERNKDIDSIKLPSPADHHANEEHEDDLDLDLEAELEQALEKEMGADESSESEEE